VLTLYLTPVIYIYFDRLQTWLQHRRGGGHQRRRARRARPWQRDARSV